MVVSASILALTDDPALKDLLLEMALADGFGELFRGIAVFREEPGFGAVCCGR